MDDARWLARWRARLALRGDVVAGGQFRDLSRLRPCLRTYQAPFVTVAPREIRRDALLALRFRLPHDGSHYNAVQRLLYVLAGCGIALAIMSGLAIWKPVQLYPLTELLGGYEIARRVHFVAMAGTAGFIIVHLVLVAIVPRTLLPMLKGRV